MDAAMTPEETALEVMSGDEQIIAVAKARWQRCQDFEGTAQQRWLADQKFHWADPDNGWQWPGYLWSTRRDDPAGYKPRLTVNKIRQHNLQITNDAKQNKPGIKISPVGDDATFQAAKIWMGLVRHIERVSKASAVYSTASDFQVQSGLGYIRLDWAYIPGTFDREIYIRRVRNPLNIFLDPDKNEIDGSDARFGFVFDDTPRTEFLAEHPEMKGKVGEAALGNSHGWIDQDHVRQAEYFYKQLKKDRLVLLKNPDADGAADALIMAKWSKIPPAIRRQIEPGDIVKQREFMDEEMRWVKIAGNEIIDRKRWPGKYVPLVPVVGEEVVIDGILDRKGHTRGMKDAQRMYNFWTSNAVEQVALQTKAKWFIPVGSTESLDAYFKTINTSNYPYIPINAFDSEGRQLPPPVPIDPPEMAQGYIQGMMVAREELMMVSGQREENFGQPSNAISAVAINERQRKGDTSTYHYIDGLATAIRQVGNIILDLAPYIYNTKQVRQILAEDGSEQLIRIDPNSDVAYAEEKDGDETWVVFNPRVGRYWVDSDIGPSYATRRQEAWDAFIQLTTQNQQLTNLIGDLMFRNADFPGADEIADRLKRMVPPQATGEGPDAALQAAQAQNQSLQSLLTDMTDKLAKQELQIKDHAERRRIEQQDADTRRLKEVGNAESDLSEETLRPILEKLLKDMGVEQRVEPSDAGGEPEGPEQEQDWQNDPVVPPVDGAQLAPDGQHYLPDEARPGKYLRVEPGG
jgi:hypothetical protein